MESWIPEEELSKVLVQGKKKRKKKSVKNIKNCNTNHQKEMLIPTESLSYQTGLQTVATVFTCNVGILCNNASGLDS